MNFKDKKLVIGMIATVCILSLVGLLFINACDAKPAKKNKASVEDNLKEFLAIYKKDPNINSYEPFYQFMSSLDQESSVQLARRLLKESNGKIVYFASNILIFNGREDDAIPALANLITSGRADTDLKGRLGYDWEHTPNAYPWLRIYIGICRYMMSNWANYSDTERVLAYRTLSSWLQLDSHSTYSADVVERAIKKLESELPDSKKDK